MKYALALIACLLSSGCAMAPSTPDPTATIAIQKSGCGYIAACPTYSMSMKPDGAFSYEGFRHIGAIGVREGQLPAGAWEKAEAAFAAAGWDTLENPTSRAGGIPCMSDSPVVRITRRVRDGEEKVFIYNLGCESERGQILLTAIDAILAPPSQ